MPKHRKTFKPNPKAKKHKPKPITGCGWSFPISTGAPLVDLENAMLDEIAQGEKKIEQLSWVVENGYMSDQDRRGMAGFIEDLKRALPIWRERLGAYQELLSKGDL
jgi:hypothetical protein